MKLNSINFFYLRIKDDTKWVISFITAIDDLFEF